MPNGSRRPPAAPVYFGQTTARRRRRAEQLTVRGAWVASLRNPSAPAQRRRHRTAEQQQSRRGEAGADLAPLLARADLRAEPLVDLVESAGVLGGERRSARQLCDLPQRLRIGWHGEHLAVRLDLAVGGAERDRVDRHARRRRLAGDLGRIPPCLRGAVGEQDDRRRRTVGVPVPEDRKSTRLNSSHANISYAVFCLKKKKNKTQQYFLSHKKYKPSKQNTT